MTDLDKINDSLRALRDHFEAKGQKFIVAWYLDTGEKVFDNAIASSATPNDYGHAILHWAHQLQEYVDDNKNHK